MPCNSEYLRASSGEKTASMVACFIDETEGRSWTRADLDGYHPRVYNKPVGREELDGMVSELCSRLEGQDVTRYSLELQIWWRDHQIADAARLAAEATEAERQAALDKLTHRERQVLGLLGRNVRTKP